MLFSVFMFSGFGLDSSYANCFIIQFSGSAIIAVKLAEALISGAL